MEEDLRDLSFGEKLLEQIEGVSPAAYQLAAELLYVVLLPEHDTGTAKKLEHINAVLTRVPDASIPSELREALGTGIASYGQGRNRRDTYLRFFIEFLVRWTALPLSRRAELLSDPWEFRDLVEETPKHSGAPQAEALLYVVFPDTFEPIIAPEAKRKIAKRFDPVVPKELRDENVDRKIAALRSEIDPVVGQAFTYYDEPVRRVWASSDGVWSEFLDWATRLYESPEFDANERDDKFTVAERVRDLRATVESGAVDWKVALGRVFAKPNNLTNWQANDTFTKWCVANPEEAARLLERLWSESDVDSHSLSEILGDWPEANRPGNRLSLASLFLMGVDAPRYPPFRSEAFRIALELVGRTEASDLFGAELDDSVTYRPEDLASSLNVTGLKVRNFLRERYPRDESEHGSTWALTAEQAGDVIDHFRAGDPEPTDKIAARYFRFLEFFDEVRLRMLTRGVRLRDRLDAQGLMWWIAKNPPPESWTAEEQERFLAWRNKEKESDVIELDVVELGDQDPAMAELAEELSIDVGFLVQCRQLLEWKRQVIFHGPPGTGKTFVAKRLAETIAGDKGRVRLIQFHPSYAYEDFVEGYRPSDDAEGKSGFKLVDGPLKEWAENARGSEHTWVLLIDEINRGNIAKIFGELYFLLEYRGEHARLQYSQQAFDLPENLLIIGTMNTADRSIALVDSALRRRFYFVPFFPDTDPIKGLLARWLAKNRPEMGWVADMLDEANSRLLDYDNRHGAIGPSHFMLKNPAELDEHRVKLIWEHGVIPTIEERLFGREDDMPRFALDSLRGGAETVLGTSTEPVVVDESVEAPIEPDDASDPS